MPLEPVNRPLMDAIYPWWFDQPLSLTSQEVGYIAGLVDGEGTIDIRRHKKDYKFTADMQVPRLRVGNTNRQVIEWLSAKLGGTISINRSNEKHGHKRAYNYSLENAKTLRWLLPQIIPCLIIKRGKAQELLAFIDTMKERAHANMSQAQKLRRQLEK